MVIGGWLIGQIPINTIFEVKSNNPIDDRYTIATLADTSTIPFKWNGLITKVLDTGQRREWNGTYWAIYNPGGASAMAAAAIRDSLAALVGANRLDASAIKNLPSASGADTVATYTAFRAYTGGSDLISVQSTGVRGLFTKNGYIPSVDNGGTTIIDGNGVTWERVRPNDNVYYVDWFGAEGDGTTDDITAIRAALSAGSEGDIMVFSPGKTYLISDRIDDLSSNDGFTFYGYGATIKRANENLSRTTEAVPDGQGYVLVQNASLFAVNDRVTLLDTTGVYNGTAENESMPSTTVSSISGDTLFLNDNVSLPPSGNLATQYPSGTKVLQVFEMLSLSDNFDNKVLGLTFDGNAAGNPSQRGWIHNHTIKSIGGNSVIRDCFFKQTPCENIFIDRGVIANCFADSLYGSFAHFTTTNGGKIVATGNIINAPCLATEAVNQHNEGAFTFSANSDYVILSNNIVNNGKEAFAAPIESDDDKYVLIEGNTAINCEAGAILGSSNQNATTDGLIVKNNHFENCLKIEFSRSGNGDIEDGAGKNAVQIAGNYLVNTRMLFEQVSYLDIKNNTMQFDSGYVDVTADAAILLNDMGGQINIAGNIIYQDSLIFTSGIIYQNSDHPLLIKQSASVSSKIAYATFNISGNHIFNFDRAIDQRSAFTNQPTTYVYLGSRIADNTIVNRDQSDTTSIGIYGYAGFEIAGNTLYGPNNAAHTADSDVYLGIIAKGVDSLQIDTLQGEFIHHNIIYGFSESIQVGKDATPASSGYNIIAHHNYCSGLLDDNSDSSAPSSVLFNESIKVPLVFPRPYVRKNTSFY